MKYFVIQRNILNDDHIVYSPVFCFSNYRLQGSLCATTIAEAAQEYVRSLNTTELWLTLEVWDGWGQHLAAWWYDEAMKPVFPLLLSHWIRCNVKGARRTEPSLQQAGKSIPRTSPDRRAGQADVTAPTPIDRSCPKWDTLLVPWTSSRCEVRSFCCKG